MTNNTPKEWREEFDEKFFIAAYSPLDGSFIAIRVPDKDEIKSFISETLERERTLIIKMIEEMKKNEVMGDGLINSHTHEYNTALDDLLSKLREKE